MSRRTRKILRAPGPASGRRGDAPPARRTLVLPVAYEDLLDVSTDPQDEEFDLLDRHGRQTGLRKRRGDVHRDGDWHAAMHVWVAGVDGDGPFVLLQRRSQTKDTWPGYLDVAVGGHLRAGESFAETVREADEEIGLEIAFEDVVRIGRRFMGAPGDGDREVQEIFATRCDLPLEAYTLHPEEVDGVARVALDDVVRLFRGDTPAIPVEELARGARLRTRDEMRVSDFAGRDRELYARLSLERVEAVIRGDLPDAFEIRDVEL